MIIKPEWRVGLQNLPSFNTYVESIDKGEIPISRALMTNKEERAVRELILQLKIGKVSIPYFQDKFSIDIREQFSVQFNQLKAEGLLKIDEQWITLEREALLKVDSFLPSFFLDKHKPRNAA